MSSSGNANKRYRVTSIREFETPSMSPDTPPKKVVAVDAADLEFEGQVFAGVPPISMVIDGSEFKNLRFTVGDVLNAVFSVNQTKG
jgi:hypothetical protein